MTLHPDLFAYKRIVALANEEIQMTRTAIEAAKAECSRRGCRIEETKEGVRWFWDPDWPQEKKDETAKAVEDAAQGHRLATYKRERLELLEVTCQKAPSDGQ